MRNLHSGTLAYFKTVHAGTPSAEHTDGIGWRWKAMSLTVEERPL